MLSCLPWPPSARPLHCGSCWAQGHHNGPSVGTDGGPFGRGHKKKQKNSQGRRAVVSDGASSLNGRDMGGHERWRSFYLIMMQGAVSFAFSGSLSVNPSRSRHTDVASNHSHCEVNWPLFTPGSHKYVM